MSEQIIVANRHLVCDLCGYRIPKGCKCRMIKDDFLPFMTYFEHLNCPSGPAVARQYDTPNKPVINNRQPLAALA